MIVLPCSCYICICLQLCKICFLHTQQLCKDEIAELMWVGSFLECGYFPLFVIYNMDFFPILHIILYSINDIDARLFFQRFQKSLWFIYFILDAHPKFLFLTMDILLLSYTAFLKTGRIKCFQSLTHCKFGNSIYFPLTFYQRTVHGSHRKLQCFYFLLNMQLLQISSPFGLGQVKQIKRNQSPFHQTALHFR